MIALICGIMSLTAVAQTGTEAYEAELDKVYQMENPNAVMTEILSSNFKTLVEQGMLTQAKCDAMTQELADAIMPMVERLTKQLWRENFTYEELQQVGAWLSSTTGQKMLKLTTQSSAIMQQAVSSPEFQQKIMTIVSKYMQ